MKSLSATLLILGCLAVTAAAVPPVAPHMMTFQGRLLDNAGNPLADGAKGIRIVIWNSATGTAPSNEVWNSGALTVTTEKGLFSVVLGVSPQPAIDPAQMADSSRWVGITVGADPEMSPRIRLGSAPYAWSAQNANWAATAAAATSVDWSGVTGKPSGFADGVDDNTVYTGFGPVSVTGTSISLVPNSLTDGNISNSASIAPYKINGTAATLAGGGTQTFTGSHNVFSQLLTVGDSAFRAHGSGPSQMVEIGALGGGWSDRVLNIARSFSSSGATYGLSATWKNNGSGGGSAGRFTATSSGGAGSTANGVYGVAVSNAGNGIGVRGEAYSNNYGYGVLADAYSNATTNWAVYGRAQGTSPIAVKGEAYNPSSSTSYPYGVMGSGNGNSIANYAYGVFGSASGGLIANYAGYFSGNVHVTGTLSKGAGAFRIDHPLDPENKYLQHSFVESPEMKNIYDGMTTTDANGIATVTMPAWFDALNQDFRYQLTVIGQFAQAIVSSELNGNSFSIQTDKPNVKVCWQVTGIRKDAFANANRIQVEVDKRSDEKAKYLHPEAFGLDKTRGIDWEQTRETEDQTTDRARTNNQ